MYEAVFRIDHDGAYTTPTRGTDVQVELWCNDHCDLLHARGSAADRVLDEIADRVGVRDRIAEGEERVVITDECLRAGSEDTIEAYLARHGCLLVPPLRYADGAKFCRVLALDGTALTDCFRDLVVDYDVTVEHKREIGGVRPDAPLLDLDGLLPDLSPRQRETLRLAHERGYYRIPRETTMAEVAAELGVERRTAEEHLRRTEGKLVDAVIEFV